MTQQTQAPRYYFAFGANTNRDAMTYRCPAAVPVGPAVLPDFALAFRLHADVLEREGAEVHGALWVLTPACERALDRFEGFPTYYVKRDVTVRARRGRGWRKVRAFVYVMAEDIARDLTPPSPSYESTLRAGYESFGLPARQLADALSAARRAWARRALTNAHGDTFWSAVEREAAAEAGRAE